MLNFCNQSAEVFDTVRKDVNELAQTAKDKVFFCQSSCYAIVIYFFFAVS